MLPLRLWASQKSCFFTSVCCLRGLGRLKKFVFSQSFVAFEAWSGLKTLNFHRFLLPLRLGASQKLCFFTSVCCLRGLGRLKSLVFSQGVCCLRGLGRLKNLVFSQLLLPPRPWTVQKLCVFICFCCLRGWGRLQNFVFSQGVCCLRGLGRLKNLVLS